MMKKIVIITIMFLACLLLTIVNSIESNKYDISHEKSITIEVSVDEIGIEREFILISYDFPESLNLVDAEENAFVVGENPIRSHILETESIGGSTEEVCLIFSHRKEYELIQDDFSEMPNVYDLELNLKFISFTNNTEKVTVEYYPIYYSLNFDLEREISILIPVGLKVMIDSA